jgi:tetratricopeptide (TPR) repeat protein
VISVISSELFRDRVDQSISEIANILDVKYILRGSVHRDAEKVSISIELLNAANDHQVLSRQYDRDIHDVIEKQAEITDEIAEALSPLFTEKQETHLRKNRTDNWEAFNYYQMGKHQFCTCNNEEVLSSIEYYKKAIKADSNYALAYAGMAASYALIASNSRGTDREQYRNAAMSMALKALEKDPDLGEAYMALGTVYHEIDFDMAAAQREFSKAIEKNSNSAQILNEYAEFLNAAGRTKEARAYMDEAIVLDPLSFSIRRISTILYVCEGNYEEALKELQRSMELVSDLPNTWRLAFFIHLGLQDDTAAYISFKKFGSLTGGYSPEATDSAYRTSGVEGLLNLMIKESNYAFVRARCYAWLGDHEKALEILESQLEQNRLAPFCVTWIEAINNEIQSDPRFIAIKDQLGLTKL